MTIKICSRCKETKDIDEFNINRTSKDGHTCYCRPCNKIIRKEWDSKYIKTNKFKEVQHKYITSDKGKKKNLKWYYKNKEKVLENQRKYRKTEEGRAKEKRYRLSEKYRSKRVSGSFSTRMRQSLNGHKNGEHWEDLVDYTLHDLREHLELLFKPDMSWENYGFKGWHIDHIRPISSYNIISIDCDDFKECWSLNNLQPLWAKENFKKGDKW